MAIHLTTFTPGEAERITSVATVMQRDWRRRGFLPSNEGHARFDAFAVAELWTLKLLIDRGVTLQEAKEVSDLCAIGIVYEALHNHEAFEGFAPEDWALDDGEGLRRRIIRSYTGAGLVPAPFLIWWADGSHHFDKSLDRAFNKCISSAAQVIGPVIVLDLLALGLDLVKRCARPLVHVEIEK